MHTRFTPKRFLLFILIFVSSLNIFAAAGGRGGVRLSLQSKLADGLPGVPPACTVRPARRTPRMRRWSRT